MKVSSSSIPMADSRALYSLQENTDVPCCRPKRFVTPTHVDCRKCRWDSGVTGLENNCFSHRLIQQQLVARNPTLVVDGACFDSTSSNICVTRLLSREVNIKLSVIGIHMVLQVVSSEYGSEWHAVDGKQYRTKYRSLRYTTVQLLSARNGILNINSKCSIRQVGCYPRQR
ncbi:hypothetical protein NP493_2388g00004 [Ridgeia piscesae]|uniref:Uncharacterized protein n=1 Tax=Ridgeia piscesae TaxID=27915 RepID=A0AAD9N2D0_RIDPI|nr:hypothetical protein NP493_2388g00004 [Ridgeia piscesae]